MRSSELEALGFDKSIAARISEKKNASFRAILSTGKRESVMAVTVYRGFVGQVEDYQPTYQPNDGKVWVDLKPEAPMKFASGNTNKGGYLIEYQIPKAFFLSGKTRLPEIESRGIGIIWGHFKRSEVRDELPFIKSVWIVLDQRHTAESSREIEFGVFDFDDVFQKGKYVGPLGRAPKRIVKLAP